MDRLETFRTFIARAPGDPFPRYGLAMELKTAGDLDGARAAFAELLEAFPDYVPTYLMAGGLARERGTHDEAVEIYRTGIEVATRRGDQHARRELESALAEITPT